MRRTAGIVMAALLMAFAATACGGDNDDAAPDGQFDDSAAGEPRADEASTKQGASVEEARTTVGETVRYAAFRFEIGDAVLAPSQNAVDVEGNPDPTVAQLTIDAVVENLGEDDTAPDQSQMYLEQAGEPLDLDSYAFEGLPVVPAGETGNAEIVFDGLPSDFDLDTAEMVFGNGDVNQARVPLGDEGETVALEPIAATPASPGQAGEVTITVDAAELVYDDPVFHQSLPAGDALLLVDFTVATGAGLDRAGGVFFGGEHIRLVLPDGTSLAPETFSNIGEVLEPSATYDGQFARFTLPSDLRGSFELALRGPFQAGTDGLAGDVEGSATFELAD